MKKRIVVVSGATGMQGGSVVRALLSTKEGKDWHIKALTRDARSEKAKQLEKMGVEVVSLNLFNKQGLTDVLRDADAFFAVTNFFDPEIGKREVELGKQMVDCAKEANIKHFIWSTLPNMEEISRGKWKAPFFTNKAIVEEDCRKRGLWATYVSLGFYYQNFTALYCPTLDRDNETLVFSLPIPNEKVLSGVDAGDIGPAVVTALNNPTEWKDKLIPLLGENCTMHPPDYAAVFSEVTGRKARYNQVTFEEFGKSQGEFGHDLCQMFGYLIEYDRYYFGPNVDPNLGQRANPKLHKFRDWLKESGWTGPCKPEEIKKQG